LPISVVRSVGDWFGDVGDTGEDPGDGVRLNASYAAVYLIGRGLSALCDIGTVLMTHAIGRALYGNPVGLLAAAFYALAVLPIQQAHFFTVDAFAAWWVAVAFWLAVRAVERARWWDDLLFGVALGCGVATKISVFLVALPFVLAVGQRVIGHWPRAGDRSRGAVRRKVALLARAMLSLNLAAIVALLCFRLLHPYAFVPTSAGATRPADASVLTLAYDRGVDILVPQMNPAWLQQMAEVGRMMSGNYDQPPNHQWATRTPLLFPWLNMVRFGFGWLLGLTAWAGWIWALAELVRRRPGAGRHLLPVAWVAVYFGWYGTQWVCTMRYFLPVYPTLAVLAAWALLRLSREEAVSAGGLSSLSQRRLGAVALALVSLGTLAWAVAFTSIYKRPHPRVAASRWFFANVPAGATIATEGEWEDAIPISLDGHDPWGTMYRSRALQMVAPDTPAKRDHLQTALDESEYLVISSNRLYGSLTRNPRRWPMTMEVYRSVFSEQLGFDLVADFTSFPRLGPLWIDDSGAEEAFTVYDHPRVFVFKKGSAYRSETTRVILARADLSTVEIRRADQVEEAPLELPIPPPRGATGGTRDGAG
jgi:4-amino-4-deoxy-L-arabinose transferase-like glycosyltransferase